MKSLLRKLMLIVMFVLLLSGVLVGCGKNVDIDLSGYYPVTYDCMGGNIDRLSSRTLYAKPGSLLVEPKGTSGFVAPQKNGYSLMGWYKSHGDGIYTPSTTGEYIYYFNFILDETNEADYVGYPYYYAATDGEYVAVQGASSEDITYTLYDATNEEHSSLQRYGMILRYELFDGNNPKHTTLSRYTADEAYILFDDKNPDHIGRELFNAEFTWDEADKWDFANDRMGEEKITLYARWVKRLKIILDFNDGLGHERVYENGVLEVEINRGETIKERNVIPDKKDGYTFTYWYKDPECTHKWDFKTDVYPTDESITELRLYAGYEEGVYTRVLSKQDLQKITTNLNGKYLLINDIDMENECFFTNGRTTFKGELNGLGHKITNCIVSAWNNKLEPRSFGFFNNIENAIIKNLELDITLNIREDSTSDLYIGAIAGCDNGGSIIENCVVQFTATTSLRECSSDINAGLYVGIKHTDTIISSCTGNTDDWNDILTTGTLTIN